MSKSIAYIRVSTEDQEAQGTQEAQTNAINAFCLSRGFQVQEWFEEQESTLNPDRPEFQRLMQKVRSGEVTTIVVAALDRFSRDQIETLQAVETIKNAKASFHCIRDNINITNGEADFASEMVISVMSLFAKNERETIRTRTMAGKERKRQVGKWVIGSSPLGYEVDRQNRTLRVNESEAEIVKRIFNLRLSGYGVFKIVRILNREVPLYEKRYTFKKSRYCKFSEKQRTSGYCRVRYLHSEYAVCVACVKANKGVDITGSTWVPTSVRKVLRNRTYLGEIPSGQNWVPGLHEPLIDPITFDRIQQIMQDEHHHPYQHYPKNIYTGIVYCSCGSRMHQNYGGRTYHIDRKGNKHLRKKYHAFYCPRHRILKCDQTGVTNEAIDKKVSQVMFEHLTLNNNVTNIIRAAYKKLLDNQEVTKPDIGALKKKQSLLNDQLKRLIRSYTQASAAGITDDVLSEMLEQMKVAQQQRDTLSNKIKFIESQGDRLAQNLTISSAELIISDLFHLWRYLFISDKENDRMAAGQFLRAFISRIEISGKKIKPIVTFDEELLNRPMDEILQVVLTLHQLWINGKDFPATSDSTEF